VAALVAALLAVTTPCRADGAKGSAKNVEVDTEDLFGFVSIGGAGETELESDAIIRAGRSTGSFADTAAQFQYKYTAFQNFRITAAATFAYYGIAGVTDMADRHAAAVQSLSFDGRFRLLDRDHSPFGLTLSAAPHWGLADETTGARINHFGRARRLVDGIAPEGRLHVEPPRPNPHGASPAPVRFFRGRHPVGPCM
jgi:hypothetical protein